MKTKLFILILLNNILILFAYKYYIDKKKPITPTAQIRIVDWGFFFEGGTLCICYINQSNEFIKIYVDKRAYPKGTKRKIDTGRIYLNIYPDDKNYIKDDKMILEIIKDLKYWYYQNIKIYTNKNVEEYSIELKEKLKDKDIGFDDGYNLHFEYIGMGHYIEEALKNIKKKYPELYALAP